MTSIDERRNIMKIANAQPMTVNGVRVAVSGTHNNFAKVTIADIKHPFYGWSTEYAWQTITYIVNSGGTEL